jgi:pimeloyl-ACP methyl ester carboxylesterase
MTQTNPPNLPMATVVLVHAAWADASSWNKIIPPLQRRGLHAYAVQIPLTSLSDDAATLRQFLKRVSRPVVLVGHSNGGAVITAAGSGNADVKALVYISRPWRLTKVRLSANSVPPQSSSSIAQWMARSDVTEGCGSRLPPGLQGTRISEFDHYNDYFRIARDPPSVERPYSFMLNYLRSIVRRRAA